MVRQVIRREMLGGGAGLHRGEERRDRKKETLSQRQLNRDSQRGETEKQTGGKRNQEDRARQGNPQRETQLEERERDRQTDRHTGLLRDIKTQAGRDCDSGDALRPEISPFRGWVPPRPPTLPSLFAPFSPDQAQFRSPCCLRPGAGASLVPCCHSDTAH